MAAIKLVGFRGRAPRQSSELLPEMSAQVARNCKLYSGDLLPYRNPSAAGVTGRNATVRGLYALRDPNGALVWLSWLNGANVATPTVITDPQEQAIYYTEDGPPRTSNYALATSSGSPPYPNAAFLLGLPLPSTQLTPVPQAVTSSTVASIARANNEVTITTTGNHGLFSGSPVKITGIPDVSGTYSQSGTTLTVTLTAHGFTTGSDIPLALTSGSSGSPASGSYSITVTDVNTFTAVMPNSATDSGTVVVSRRAFNGDSVPVTVTSSTVFSFTAPGYPYATKAVTGANVTLSGSPQLRFYTYTWVSDKREESANALPSENTLAREGQFVVVGNIPTAKPQGNYNVRGVRIYRTLAGTRDAEFFRLQTLWFPTEITSVQRTNNVATISTRDKHMLAVGDRILINNMSTTNASFNVTGATVASVPNANTFTFTQVGANAGPLFEPGGNGKLFYDVAQNKQRPATYWTSSSFTDDFDTRLLFTTLRSGDYAPPPPALRGLTALSDNVFAGFVGNSLYFSEPGQPHAWPTKYIRVLEHPIVGIASIAGSVLVMTQGYPYLLSGSSPAIMDLRRIDALYPCVAARSIATTNTGVMYATHDGIALFSIGSGPLIVSKNEFESTTWSEEFDPSTIVAQTYNDKYFASHSTGSFVFEVTPDGNTFVDCDEIFTATWYDNLTNKVYFTRPHDNNVYQWDDPAETPQRMVWKSKTFTTPDYLNFGAARVLADYQDLAPGDTVVFKLWANKALVFTRELLDNRPFRLPTGYRADTFEFGVESRVRIRAIHVAETMIGLKSI